MKVRTRDFIYTKDDLFFASTNYIHPQNRLISFLRYIPDHEGHRKKNGRAYSKVTSDEAYNYLRKNHPEYIYTCDITKVEMIGVPLNKVEKIISPVERLKEIRTSLSKHNDKSKENNYNIDDNNAKIESDDLLKKVVDLSDFFHYKAKIPYDNLGISGSILLNLHQKDVSDIDFVIYGLKNHRRAMETFKKFKNKNVKINQKDKKIKISEIGDRYWEKVYDKRMKDSSLSKKEFFWYEKRKNNRGLIDGTLFDILATRNWDEIKGKWGEIKYTPIGISIIEATVKNAITSFDNPAIYEIENLKVIGGVNKDIKEIVSFTHTYAGQAKEGEKIIAKGKVESVSKNNSEISHRLVVGTTRESIDEFIKLKNSSLIK